MHKVALIRVPELAVKTAHNPPKPPITIRHPEVKEKVAD
jgi:hypothetical protein